MTTRSERSVPLAHRRLIPLAFLPARRMSCLRELLQAVAQDLETRVRAELGGPLGALVKGYLPQRWVFQTENETLTLQIERDGRAETIDGIPGTPDVTIETSHDRLAAALRHRRQDMVPPGPFKATPHTPKGRTAFNFLRNRLGL